MQPHETATEQITCPRCEGRGHDAGLSAPDDEYPCVTCRATGKVHHYGGAVVSSGGVSVEIRVVGHREPPTKEDWQDETWDELCGLAGEGLDRVRETAWWKRAVKGANGA